VIIQTQQVPLNSPSWFLLAASELALLVHKELTTLPLRKHKKKADTHLLCVLRNMKCEVRERLKWRARFLFRMETIWNVITC